MPTANNIFNTKINRVGTTAKLNMGNAINIRPTNHAKEVGRLETIGDFSLNVKAGSNWYIDPDILDNVLPFLHRW